MKQATGSKVAGTSAPATATAADTPAPVPQHGGGHIATTPRPPTVLPRDALHGKGGDYVMVNGERRAVQASAPADTQNPAGMSGEA